MQRNTVYRPMNTLSTAPSLKLVFMGSPAFALPTLQTLIDSPHDIVAAYTQPPRPAGRGQKLTPSPVHTLAEKNGISVYTPLSLKKEDVQQTFESHKADAAIVVAYGLLLPEPILNAYPMGCLNVHPSDLPRWRGAAPLHRTIMAGDTHSALCIMQMDKGLDTGAVLHRTPFPVPTTMTTGELHDLCANMAGDAILQTLNGLCNNTLTPVYQSLDNITYADKISKEEARIDWSKPAQTLYNHIRGLCPYPGAYFTIGKERIKLFASRVVELTEEYPPGTIYDNTLTVACGVGALQLLELQRPGKKRTDAKTFLQQMELPKNMQLNS